MPHTKSRHPEGGPQAASRTQGVAAATADPALAVIGSNVTAELAAEHGLSAEEFERAVAILGRTPNLTELGVFSAMWSEHCSYKSSKIWLEDAADRGAARHLRARRARRGHRYRRRRRRGLQDREPQPPLIHRAVQGRGDRGRRHSARCVHDGRAADRPPQLAALWRPRPPEDAASRIQGCRRHRRLRQLRRGADGRRRVPVSSRT